MIGSAGDLNAVSRHFLKSFSQLTSHLSSSSRYALIPFIDTAETPLPRPPHTGAYYKPGSKADSIDFLKAIDTLEFGGGTNIDTALLAASYMLQFSFSANKAIVLVTDDIVRAPDSMARLLIESGIKLFVLEVGKDNAEKNFDLARKTGGTYYQASDSLTYDSYMSKVAELISSEHCTLSYRSPLQCPWNKNHSVSVRLDAGSLSKTNWHGYALSRTPSDTLAPAITMKSPLTTCRTLFASENYPCESGLMKLQDSILENFQRVPLDQTFPLTAGDSLFVIDPVKPARAIYVALDSFFNRSIATATYFPSKDTESLLPFIASKEFIDFTTKTAPVDTSVMIDITNPNNKTLTIDKILRYGAIGRITTDLTSPLTFQAHESKTVSLRFTTDLLGDYNAKYELYADTLKICTITGIGKTIGLVRLRIDTARAFTGDTGTLNLSFDAIPAPINLDTLSFYLRYDGDLIEFHPDLPDCSGDNPLCNYNISYSQIDNSTLRIDLFLNKTEQHPVLNFAAAILPLSFQSFLTQSSSSIIHIENINVSQGCIVTSDTGLIKVSDRCGDDLIRTLGLNSSGFSVQHISPNPAKSEVQIHYRSNMDAACKIRLFNSLGNICLSRQLETNKGPGIMTLNVGQLPSGRYILAITSSQGSTSAPIIVSK
jgi:hypothetical protein